jgi:hypothetical protein
MKTYKDLFLDQAADVHGTSRRIIKASLKMGTAENGSPDGQSPAGSENAANAKEGTHRLPCIALATKGRGVRS